MASATLSLSLARIGTGPTESRMSLRATSSASPRTCASASAPADSLNRRCSARNSCTAKSPSGCDQPLNTEWHPSVDGHSTCSRITRVIIRKEKG
jgi:hypothetical protein